MIVRAAFCLLVWVSLVGQMASQVDFLWKEGRAVAVQFKELRESVTSEWIITLEKSHQPIFGRWSASENTSVFHPVIPFNHDQKYLLKSDNQVWIEFALPSIKRPLTRLLYVYPSHDTVPENLLKIHLQFSAPMGERYSEEFLMVTNEIGDTLKNIFLPLQPELWNGAHDRLTLWLDPGRIKRGLGPNLAEGQPLEMGHSYSIRIRPTWKDRRGRPLEKGLVKKLYAGAAVRERLNPEDWQLLIPASNSEQPLILEFTYPLDRVLGNECISVLHENVPIKGKVSLAQQETEWHFVPMEKWVAGQYFLRIESRLEDLAGNNPNRPFDKAIDSDRLTKEKEHYDLPFLIK